MKKIFITILILSSLTLIPTTTHAKQRAAEAMGDMAPPEPPDPKKKNPGDECKVSDECQRHHECKKKGDKGICTAPEPHKLPPGVVT